MNGDDFEHVEGSPSPALAGAVRRYAGYRGGSVEPLRRREPAQDAVALILNFGPTLAVSGPGFPAVDADSFLAPLFDTYAITETGTASYGLQVDLTPLGAHMLLGVPMRDLSELIVPFEDVLGREAPLLVERLFLAAGWAARFRLLDDFIAHRLAQARPPSPDVIWAWRRLCATSGRLPVGSLAQELGCSRRHLVARFREQIGPAPKTAARILRFRNTTKLLGDDDGSRLAEIAQRGGYYDQAHLNRDFRAMAGTTPGAYLASRLSGGPESPPEVTFVQDAGPASPSLDRRSCQSEKGEWTWPESRRTSRSARPTRIAPRGSTESCWAGSSRGREREPGSTPVACRGGSSQ